MHEPREPMSAAGALSALQRISGPDASRSRYTLLINGVGVILLASVLLGAVAVLVRLATAPPVRCNFVEVSSVH